MFSPAQQLALLVVVLVASIAAAALDLVDAGVVATVIVAELTFVTGAAVGARTGTTPLRGLKPRIEEE